MTPVHIPIFIGQSMLKFCFYSNLVSLSQKNPIGRFLLLIMEAQDLTLTDALSSNEKNFFCEATMCAQKFSTHSLDSTNPKWNTSMQFQIYDLKEDFLSVSVYDRRTFSPNTLLGKTDLKMLQIYKEQTKENQENNMLDLDKSSIEKYAT